MRYLAIDLGEKRTGLAVGDDESGIVNPAGRIDETDESRLLSALAAAVEAHEADALVVGLPLNMDGSEGPAAMKARALSEKIAARCGKPVHLADERLTTFAADKQFAGMDLTRGRKKQRRDALAAATILRDFFDQAE